LSSLLSLLPLYSDDLRIRDQGLRCVEEISTLCMYFSNLLVAIELLRESKLTDLANDATTPGHNITTEATYLPLWRYIGVGGPFCVNKKLASAVDTPVMCTLRVTSTICGYIH
jgi:hypothetical protein